METKKNIYVWRTVASFLLVLFAMPLGHALMILMEKLMSEGAMHVAGFLMGLVGLVMVIVGVFVKGDTCQTLWGRCAARDGKRRGGHQARIPHSAGLVRHVDDDDGDVYLQHQERL